MTDHVELLEDGSLLIKKVFEPHHFNAENFTEALTEFSERVKKNGVMLGEFGHPLRNKEDANHTFMERYLRVNIMKTSNSVNEVTPIDEGEFKAKIVTQIFEPGDREAILNGELTLGLRAFEHPDGKINFITFDLIPSNAENRSSN